ncbi:alpha-(1,3)-fucosyltransferase C-like [Hyposmocoma kahamanoa]|uniref:alpha-(1,3)-fucosyltransferase C-like n=1 Tax=Hyposmocoma kahamanoa TaxID=1477025 RepID=UPI000E6D7B4E|nr:alpha-(1,3)-fucosyltransferase C-like [Hyposmocoma kahamanoa]
MIHLEVGMALPPERSTGQKYCMYGLDAAGYHSIPQYFNGYFNITFTYKLSSNITIPYVVVKDENDEIIGPALDMPWKKLSEMNNTSDYVKNKLEKKHIAAAWIVSHCETPWRRIYAQALQYELAQLGQTLDIFGKCGTKQCPKGGYGLCGTFMCPQYERMDECLAIIESDYYFYLSFENSFGEDYVTEKLLHALEHFTVPIVFGGANYNSMNKSSTIEFIAEWWNEEQPPWPTTQPDIGEQNEVEQVMTNLLDFLNPP